MLLTCAQVEGCTIEVAGQKDYHSRYKICEFHLKANVVQKGGVPHRFCQQARSAARALAFHAVPPGGDGVVCMHTAVPLAPLCPCL